MCELIKDLKYANLHGHSDYSDGFNTVEANVEQAVLTGQDGLGITDHGTCAGLIQHWKVCKENKITPILGCEFYLRLPDEEQVPTSRNSASGRFHITVLSTNFKGYERLIAVNNDAHANIESARNGKFPISSFSMYKEHFTNDGSIIFLTGCIASTTFHDDYGVAEWYVNELTKIVGKDNVYAELMGHRIQMNKGGVDYLQDSYSRPLELSKKFGLKTVWSTDFHAATAETLPILQIYTKAKKGYDFTADYIKSKEDSFADAVNTIGETEALRAFQGVDEILNRVEDINLLNSFQLPTMDDEVGKFKAIILKELEKVAKDESYQKRFQFEWELLDEYNFWPYFALVGDIVDFCRRNNILVISRGSASGSLIWYLAGGSQLDPIEHGLPFERFLARARLESGELPDIDLDIAASKRHLVQKYVQEKYNFEPVGTILTYSHSSLVRLIATIYQKLTGYRLPKEMVDDASNCIRDEAEDGEEEVEFNAYEHDSFISFITAANAATDEDNWAGILYDSLKGARSGYGRHACAIVPMIPGIPVPIEQFASESVVAYTESGVKKVLQEIGLVKVDLLSSDALDILQKMIDATGVMPPKVVSDKDPCFKIFNEVNVSGIAQFNTPSGIRILNKMRDNGKRINSIHNLSLLTSIVRPGAQDYIEDYVTDAIDTSVHPEFIREIFDRTNGVLIYQEQVYELFGRIANKEYNQEAREDGIVGGKALVPKTVRLQNDPKFIKKYEATRQRFIQGGIEYHGLEKEYLETLFDTLKGFIRYGFNLSHALSYGNLSAQQAWFKYHYPQQFWAAALEKIKTDASDREKLIKYIVDASVTSGLQFLPPHVNVANTEYQLHDGIIQCPLTLISGLGEVVVNQIIEHQPFSSLKEFNEKVDKCNKTLKLMMFYAGMFDGIPGTLLDLGVLEIKEYKATKKWDDCNNIAWVVEKTDSYIILDNGLRLVYYRETLDSKAWCKANNVTPNKSFKNLWVGHQIKYEHFNGMLVAFKQLAYIEPEPKPIDKHTAIREAIGFYIPPNLKTIHDEVRKTKDQTLGYVISIWDKIKLSGNKQRKVLLSNGETIWYFMGNDLKPKTEEFMISKLHDNRDKALQTFTMLKRQAMELKEGDLLRARLSFGTDKDGNEVNFKMVNYSKVLA